MFLSWILMQSSGLQEARLAQSAASVVLIQLYDTSQGCT